MWGFLIEQSEIRKKQYDFKSVPFKWNSYKGNLYSQTP